MNAKVVLTVLSILLGIVILYPKDIGYGYGGEVTPNQITLYREEAVCLGFKYDRHGDAFGLLQCLDCGVTYYCIGLPIEKRCYEKEFDWNMHEERRVECRKRPDLSSNQLISRPEPEQIVEP